MKKKFQMEFVVNTIPNILFNRLNTSTGLSNWFADEVTANKEIFDFSWEGTPETARRIDFKKNEFVKFRWLDDDEEYFFEFRIRKDELTGDVALIITDFAEEEVIADERNLWAQQVYQLKHALGLE